MASRNMAKRYDSTTGDVFIKNKKYTKIKF